MCDLAITVHIATDGEHFTVAPSSKEASRLWRSAYGRKRCTLIEREVSLAPVALEPVDGGTLEAMPC